MTPPYKVLISSVALVMVFGLGRYSVQAPSVKTKVDQTTNTDTTTDRDTHRETTTVTEKDPGGKTKTTTKIIEDTSSKKKIDSDTTTHTVQTVIPTKVGMVNISALAGMDLATYRPVYGASVTKELLGPISAGAFGLTNGTFGVSIGVNF